jgi:glycosyltransferase involved in cell wall biosynthesis
MTARPDVVHLLVPPGLDDPSRPSGGNVYDRRVADELAGLGWTVRELRDARALVALPDDALVLVDGMVGVRETDSVAAQAGRLRLVALVHLPFGPTAPTATRSGLLAAERALVTASRAVVVPSEWSRRSLVDTYDLPPDRVFVAPPGADPAPPEVGAGDDTAGRRLLCVGVVAPHKGQDVLVRALAGLRDEAWGCTVVGALDVEPTFVQQLAESIGTAGLADRVHLAGPRTGDDLAKTYLDADLLVLPSTHEAYGLVVLEALAHGLPVVASDVGGVPEAVGATATGDRPGVLVPPGDVVALSGALRDWLTDADLRARLRGAATARGSVLPTWSTTASRVADVLRGVPA